MRFLSVDRNDESGLVLAAARGDQQALNRLLADHLDRLTAYVRAKVPAADVDDVVQTCAMAAVESIAHFQGQSLFWSWLRSIAHHKIVDYFRAARRELDTPLLGRSLPTALRWRQLAEGEVWYLACLSRLAPRQRRILRLRLERDLSWEECGHALGVSREGARALFNRTISTLRRILDERNDL